MELRHLRYFIALAEELSFSRAARRLHVAQPPLSQRIRRLERELGVLLFERTPRKVSLTAAGEALLSDAQAILAQSERIYPHVYAAARGEHGSLSMGCVPAGFTGFVGSIVRPFLRRYPDVNLSIWELNTRAQYDALEIGQLDLAIVRTGIQSPRLATHIVCEETVFVALPVGHVLEQAPSLRINDLGSEALVFFSRQIGKWYFDHLVQICQEAGFSPSIRHECDSILAQLGMVASGLGVALVTELTAYLQIPGVLFRPICGLEQRIPLAAVWHPERLNPARDNLLAELKSWTPRSLGTHLLGPQS